MKKALERFVADHAKMVIIFGTLAILALAFLSGLAIRGSREGDRFTLLRTETDRRALELLSQTLDSSFMGGLSLLGLIDPSVKEDALGNAGSRPAAPAAKPSKVAPNGPAMTRLLGTTAKAYGAQGVFIVDAKGLVCSSWDDSGKPSTGLDVSFRPYFLMGMRGSQNIYAAVSLARGDRAIYYAAPVRQGDSLDDPAIGVIVGRSSLAEVDRLIRGRADRALLISPQGVVFAASDTAFVGKLAAEPTPDRLAAIKALRQFGKSFESGQPEALPFICDDGIWLQDGIPWATASTQIDWNDPSGPWKLVFMEDLSKSVALASWLGASGGLALAFLFLAWLMFAMAVGNHRQTLSTGRMETLAREQETRAGRKTALAAAMLRLQKKASAAELAAAYLTEAHGLIGSIQGVVYARDEERGGLLRHVADYACAEPPPSEITPGEGLLGQCATEGRTILVRSPDTVPAAKPGVFAAMRSGLGGTSPAAFVISPFFLGDHLVGVVELAFLTEPTDEALDQAGELGKLLAFGIESAERERRTDELLWASELNDRDKSGRLAFQQVLVDTIPFAVFTKGPDSRFISVNKAYEEAHGVRREDVIGKRILDLSYLPEAQRATVQEEDEAIIATQSSIKREHRMPLADGRIHDIIYHASGFPAMDGSPGGLVGTFIDVTSLEEQMAALRQERAAAPVIAKDAAIADGACHDGDGARELRR